MQYRELGRTGLKVSEIGFGGEWMDGTPEETLEVVARAHAAGINILDGSSRGIWARRGRASSTSARAISTR